MMTQITLPQELSDKIQKMAQARHMTIEGLLESLLAQEQSAAPTVEDRFKQIADYLPVVFFISDPRRKQIHYVSPAYEKIMGYPLEDAYQGKQPFLEIVHPDDRSLVASTFQQQEQGHETSMEYRVIHPDGSIHWIQSTAFPIRDANGEVIRLVGFAQDISERRQLEAEARTYQAAVEASSELMMVVDRDCRYVIVNETYLRYHQIRREDIIGKPQSHIMGEEYFTSVIKPRFERCLRGEVQNYEATYTYPILGKRHLLVNYSPLRNASCEVTGVVKTLRDVTEQKVAEQQAFNLKLEQERVNILTNFIEHASHEFRTPLAIIQSSLYLISRKDDVDYRAVKMEQIEAQIQRMTHLIDMLITLSRLDSGLDFSPVSANINAIVREVVSDSQTAFRQKNLTVHMDFGELPPLSVDSRQLAEAVHQLVANAVEFTPDNGTITIRTSHDDVHVLLEISDTGIGISDKDLPHVMERFYRADIAHTKHGFGLGLAIAQKVVAEHHGTITLSNRAEGGCTVKIMLPTT